MQKHKEVLLTCLVEVAVFTDLDVALWELLAAGSEHNASPHKITTTQTVKILWQIIFPRNINYSTL